MYIPPGFTVITCELVDEEALHLWSVANGGVWHPAEEGYYSRRPARATWDVGLRQGVESQLEPLTEADQAEWKPLMHKPPQSLIEVQLSESLRDGSEQCHSLLQALLTQWDSYAYDLGAYEWVSALLCDLLPAERIIRYEPPPPGPPTAWVWVHGKYTKNEAYYDNLDTS